MFGVFTFTGTNSVYDMCFFFEVAQKRWNQTVVCQEILKMIYGIAFEQLSY